MRNQWPATIVTVRLICDECERMESATGPEFSVNEQLSPDWRYVRRLSLDFCSKACAEAFAQRSILTLWDAEVVA